jgi:hypothetical protein
MQCTRYQSVTQPFTGKISKVCFVTWTTEKNGQEAASAVWGTTAAT